MMDHLDEVDSYSIPMGGSLYPPPPYYYRGARMATIRFEADPEPIRPLLPPGVTIEGDVATCEMTACHYPETSFGTYLEILIHVKVTVDGVNYWYQPLIFTDSEPPMAAGREIWGYAKKLAKMDWRDEAEQIIFTVERPTGKRLMTLTFTRDTLSTKPLGESYPGLAFRHIPASDPSRKPAASELVRVDTVGSLVEEPGIGKMVWRGRASVSFDSPSAVDPWHRFQPTKIIGSTISVVNFTLPLGKVVKDYLAEG